MRLEAIAARLTAIAEGRDELTFPDFLMAKADMPEVAEILASQRQAFDVARRHLAKDLDVLGANEAALRLRRVGFVAQRDGLRETIELLMADLEAKSTLLERGLIRRDGVYVIRRALADARGQIGRIEAQLDETDAMIEKQGEEIRQATLRVPDAALDELQPVLIELDSAREQHNSALNVRERVMIAAPVDSVVVQLHYNTPGGVIEPGRPILEILPAGEALIIEAHVGRADIDQLHVSQPATVRLVALNQRTTPVLEGEVVFVSPDALRDASGDRSREYYLARVALPPHELARAAGFSPTPGMPVEVIVRTTERTFAQYLFRPIADSMARAFREQ